MNPEVPSSPSRPAFSGTLRLLTASVIACTGSLIVGLSGGYPSPAVPDINAHPNPFHVSADAQSWFSSVGYLGAILGALQSGFLIDRLGRKLGLMVALVPYSLGWVTVAAAGNVPTVFAGRFLVGMSCPLIFIAINVYIVEISPPAVRGLLIALNQLFMQLGIFAIYLAGAYIHWNWLTVVCAAPTVLLVACVTPLPDTPRWLFMKKRTDEAVESLEWFRGAGDLTLSAEVGEIQESLRVGAEHVSWKDYFRKPLSKCFAISLTLFVFQELSGINVIRAYTVTIFQSTDGAAFLDANKETVVVGATMVASSVVAALVTDRFRRRVLLVVSFLAMAVGMAALGAFFFLLEAYPDLATGRLSWLPLLSLGVFILSYSVGCGPLPHAITNELFPTRVRGRAYSICIAADYAFGFLVVKGFPYLNALVGDYGTFWAFGSCCCLGVVFVFFCVPETMGRSLEQLEQTFSDVSVNEVGVINS